MSKPVQDRAIVTTEH